MDEKTKYGIATLGVLFSIILGSLDQNWSVLRTITFIICLIVVVVCVYSIVRDNK